jgi:phenylalanyl-tRNA synthetase alpha chain
VDVAEIDAPQVGIGKARSKGWIEISAGTVRKTDAGAGIEEDPVRQRLESGQYDEELQDRGLVESRQRTRRRASLTQRGHELDLESVEVAFDVESRTRTPRAGRKHFYKRIMDEARQVWLEMGFEEMDGDYVVSSLFNFDALYTPQDHPAREMQDTFFVENPERSDLSDLGNLVSNIEATHEHGWTTGSTGWGYDWSEEEAERNVLRTHTTSISAMKLHELEREQLPKKYFIVGRNFRNETLDRHHLAEFYQTDGIVVGEELSFRNLKGYISEFFRKMGYEEFRLVPSYYPYTEMSVEVQVHDGEEWIGLGGAGMFRPEVVKPLLGFEARVLAWGLGIPRIAMRNAGLEDIRELYRNDLEILENTAAWRRE